MKRINYLKEAKILFASGQLEKSIDYFTLAENEGDDSVDICLSRGGLQQWPWDDMVRLKRISHVSF